MTMSKTRTPKKCFWGLPDRFSTIDSTLGPYIHPYGHNIEAEAFSCFSIPHSHQQEAHLRLLRPKLHLRLGVFRVILPSNQKSSHFCWKFSNHNSDFSSTTKDQHTKMVADMSYSTVSSVIDSWEAVRRIDNYEEKVGTMLFVKLFDLEPEAKGIFGFLQSADLTDEVLKSKRFLTHAQYFIQMIDKALGMLGPDIELLTDILIELGQKHVGYGVKPEYFPSMGRALIHSVQSMLNEKFTDEIKDAWVEVYGALSYDMIRGQKLENKK